jgi:hypothetical protein
MYVADLQIDEDNEAEMAAHGVTPEEVWQVWTNAPRYFRNKRGRSATHPDDRPNIWGAHADRAPCPNRSRRRVTPGHRL